jgi:VWFA-related protein
MGKTRNLPFFIFLTGAAVFVPPQDQVQKIPRHDAAAVVKLVPVRVLDLAGKPVTGLKKEDFILYDNQERKTITEFEVHGLADVGPALRKIETALGTTPIPELSRKYFLLLDIQGSDVNGTANAKKAAQAFVDTKLLPGDEVAVLYYAPMTGLNVVEYLTADKNKIKKAIERARENTVDVGGRPGLPQSGPVPKEVVIMRAETEGPARSVDETGAVSISTHGAVRGNVDAGASISSSAPGLNIFGRSGPDFQSNISELAKALSYVPGTKNIIFFSARSVPKEIGRAFAASNTPVFVINTQNWIIRGGVKQKFLWTEHPLKEFAQATGGQYFADVIDVKTIADEIQSLSGHYYVLGYYVSEQWDGQLHRIRVEVNRPESKVLVQEGFYNPKPFSQWTDIEKKLQLYDLAFTDRPASQDVLEIPMQALFVHDAKGSNGLVLMKIPIDVKTGIPPGKAELFTFIFNKDSRAVQAVRGEINVAALVQKTFYPYATASLKPGVYELRFVARDMTTGQAVLGNSELTIPEPDPSGVSFFSPLVLVRGDEPLYIQMSLPKRESQRSSLINFYPLLPKEATPLVKNLGAKDKTLLAVLPAEFPSGPAPTVTLDFRLKGKNSGEEFPLETKILDSKRSGTTRSVLVLEIDLPDLAPGDYALEIAVTGEKPKIRALTRTDLIKR